MLASIGMCPTDAWLMLLSATLPSCHMLPRRGREAQAASGLVLTSWHRYSLRSTSRSRQTAEQHHVSWEFAASQTKVLCAIQKYASPRICPVSSYKSSVMYTHCTSGCPVEPGYPSLSPCSPERLYMLAAHSIVHSSRPSLPMPRINRVSTAGVMSRQTPGTP